MIVIAILKLVTSVVMASFRENAEQQRMQECTTFVGTLLYMSVGCYDPVRNAFII